MFQAKKSRSESVSEALFLEILTNAKPADSVKKLFLTHFDHGPALLEHFLLEKKLPGATKMKDLQMPKEEVAKALLEVIHLKYKLC